MNGIVQTVVHLPVFGLVLTLAVYLGSLWLHRRTGRPALLTPVFVTVVVVAAVLELVGLPYAQYLEQVTVLTLLLGPATVALALPLLANGRALARSAAPVLLALLTGAVVSLGVTVGVLRAFGTDPGILRSVLPRSVTSPVALTLAESLQASAPLAVVLTILSGILGAVFAPILLSLARVDDPRARGLRDRPHFPRDRHLACARRVARDRRLVERRDGAERAGHDPRPAAARAPRVRVSGRTPTSGAYL
jgi:putative effector of murein hydrolase